MTTNPLRATCSRSVEQQSSGGARNRHVRHCLPQKPSIWHQKVQHKKLSHPDCFLVSGAAVIWRSKKQACATLYTSEAEYMALENAAQEAVQMRQLTTDLRNSPAGTTTIFEDNQSAISMTKNPQFHGREKHNTIKHHFIREQVSSDSVELKYCPTEDMIQPTCLQRTTLRAFHKAATDDWN